MTDAVVHIPETSRRLDAIDRKILMVLQDDASLSVAEIARSWGFVHMGDFGQRYRRQYGRTPTETRRTGRAL
mgnify:CR=1 FL=1